MSTRPAIIALILTLLLAIGTYFVLKPPAASSTAVSTVAEGERLLSLDATTIRGITLHNPPAQPQIIERAAAPDGRWLWRATAKSTHTYALDETLVRTFLRKFAEAKGLATSADAKPLPDQPSPVTLTFHTAAGDTVLRLAPRALGGQVLADVTTPVSPTRRAAVLPDELLAVLTSPGPSAWRDTRALAVDPAAAARISFTDGAGANGFGLARREGLWFVTPPAPVTAPAESDMVNSVLRTLDSLTISRFFDDETHPTMQSAGLDKPSALLTLEFDDRSIDPGTQKPILNTRTARMTIGQPADTGGTTLYATVDDGRTIFAIGAAPLTKLLGPASNLIMRSATRTPAADVGAIQITDAGGKRTVKLTRDGVTGRWSETLDTNQPVTQGPPEALATETILTFLTRTAADSVAFQPPENATQRATITLLTPSGQPLDRFDLLTPPPATGNGVILRTLGVGGSSLNRFYAKTPDELVRWLAVLSR